MKALKDSRYYQIVSLLMLLAYGVCALNFDVSVPYIATILATTLITQYVFSGILDIKYDPKSPLISGLSLCIILRTNIIWIAVGAAIIAIASKFLIRVKGRHIFNPTNIAIVTMVLCSGEAWISPGQWGTDVWFAFLMACLGGLVIQKAARWDVSIGFLGFYALFCLARTLWLGDPLAIYAHQLQNGAILLFSFFMISDPKTTPDSRTGRLIFASAVAALAYVLQYHFYVSGAVIYALAPMALLVPLLNLIYPGQAYEWDKAVPPPVKRTKMKQLITVRTA